jgi:hypothetical protein
MADEKIENLDPLSMSHEQMKTMHVHDLKEILKDKNIDYKDCIEKDDLIRKIEVQIQHKPGVTES